MQLQAVYLDEINECLFLRRISLPESLTFDRTLHVPSSDKGQKEAGTESGLRLQYLVDIFNQGPGFLPLASVQIRLPIYTKDMKPIVQIYSIEVNHVFTFSGKQSSSQSR